LESILKDCSDEYNTTIKKGIAARSWKGIHDMDLQSYINLRGDALKQRSAYQDSLVVEQEEMVDE